MGNLIVPYIISSIFGLFIVVGIPLIFTFTYHETKDPEFSVIETWVSTFNLTSDDRLLGVFKVVLRAYNPDRKDTQDYSDQEVSIRKGTHHPIADDWIWGSSQDPLNGTLWRAEAVAVYKQLEKKIAAELREDIANGAGFVNVYLSGGVGARVLEVTCKNVFGSILKVNGKFSKNKLQGLHLLS